MADSNPKSESEQSVVKFDYIKSQFFRVVHADGMIGGPTTRAQLHIAFFSERAAIPQQITQIVDKTTGLLGKEIPEKAVTRGTIIRELDVDVMMNLDTAKAMYTWLGDRIRDLEQAIKQEAESRK
jgi:hypothetical protein